MIETSFTFKPESDFFLFGIQNTAVNPKVLALIFIYCRNLLFPIRSVFPIPVYLNLSPSPKFEQYTYSKENVKVGRIL